MDIPKYELGKVAAQLVIERIDEAVELEDGETRRLRPYKEIVLNPTLMKRASPMGGVCLLMMMNNRRFLARELAPQLALRFRRQSNGAGAELTEADVCRKERLRTS